MPSFKSAVALCVLLLLPLIPQESASAQSAQSEDLKFEVGVQFSAIGEDPTHIGGGGRLTYNLTRNLALEGELNYFPSTGINNIRRFQGQFGVKSGLRFDRFGVFGKLRPGFVNTKLDVLVLCPLPVCPPGEVCIPPFPLFCSSFPTADTGFSLDVGGVVEFYPAKRVTVRFDVGDTIVNRSITTHNLQLGASVGFRF